MTVPPPVIAANRTQLMSLTATNFFGQNTPAIAATEAQYSEMWAQDAAAMYGYAANRGGRLGSDAVHRGAADHQPGRASRPSHLGRHRRRQRCRLAAAHRGAPGASVTGLTAGLQRVHGGVHVVHLGAVEHAQFFGSGYYAHESGGYGFDVRVEWNPR